MTDNTALIARNAARWAAAQLTRGPEFAPVAKRLVASKVRYQAASASTGVPWFVIAVIHERESSQRWDRSLGQGDPWNAVSTHVPAGRGPFASWEEAAIDALKVCGPYAAKWTDWSVGGTLTLLELYNGRGYFNKGIPSPYVWSGTDQYRSGKYVSDGVFDPTAVDKQLGCAGLILAMKAIDPSIGFGGQTAAGPQPATPAKPGPAPAPTPVKPQASALHARNGGIAAAIMAAAAAAWAAIQAHPVAVVTAIALVILAIVLFIKHHKDQQP